MLCPVHPDAPFDHSELGYWMPRDAIFAAYVNQWLHLLDLGGEHQAILARWLPFIPRRSFTASPASKQRMRRDARGCPFAHRRSGQ